MARVVCADDIEAANEIYQESVLRIAEAERSGKVIKSLPDYFFMTLRNTYLEYKRYGQRFIAYDQLPEQVAPQPTAPLPMDVLNEPAASKRDFYKQEVVKRTLEIGSVKEAAKKLGIKKSSIYYCIRCIRERVKNETE